MDVTLKLFLKLPTEHISSPLLLKYQESPTTTTRSIENGLKSMIEDTKEDLIESVTSKNEFENINSNNGEIISITDTNGSSSLILPDNDIIIPVFTNQQNEDEFTPIKFKLGKKKFFYWFFIFLISIFYFIFYDFFLI